MGRPKLDDSEKRKQLNLRLDPATRKMLEAVAKRDGASQAAIAERYIADSLRLQNHPVMNDELLRIFLEILDEMHEMQLANHGKPWHKDLMSWAACKMVFAKGPFARRNPDRWHNSPAIQKLWAQVTKARQSKQDAINLLDQLGVTISPEAKTRKYLRSGLFGGVAKAPTQRELERVAINAMQHEQTRAQALAIFGLVEQLDVHEAEAMALWHKEVKNYTDEEQEGETLYRDWRRKVAQSQLARGEIPSYEDLF